MPPKKKIVVVDTKLVFYTQFHRNSDPLLALDELARKIQKGIYGPIGKLVLAMDNGESYKTEIFPEYKKQRRDKKDKATPAEKRKLLEFETFYTDSTHLLSHLGTVISIPRVEADDIASFIAKQFQDSETHEVILVSSDEDWARFLYTDNIKMLHYGRERIITRDSVESEFGVPIDFLLPVAALTGVAKENVGGIIKAGKGRISGLLKGLDKNRTVDEIIDNLVTLTNEWCDIHKYGFTLPDWASSAEEVYRRNYPILEPLQFEKLDPRWQESFRTQWTSGKLPIDAEGLLSLSLLELNKVIRVTPEMQILYKIK